MGAGLITPETARADYGVVVSADGELDADATTSAREQMRSSRDPRPDFDFGPLPSTEELSRQIAAERREFESALAQQTAVG